MWFPKVLMLSILFSLFQSPVSGIKKSYIVYFGSHAHGPQISKVDLDAVADSHQQFLGSYLGSGEKARDAIIYSYDRHINGFAAMLEEEEAAKIARHPNVVSVFLNQGRKLHTTHSWDFMLMEKDGVVDPSSLWKRARFGEDSIIANLDTGGIEFFSLFFSLLCLTFSPLNPPSKMSNTFIPESKRPSSSFRVFGLSRVALARKELGPYHQNGKEHVRMIRRKLIGARFFNKGSYIAYAGGLTSSDDSARDIDGHGTHTLSTAGARVASYKVCRPPVNGKECFDEDIMKAFDMAIHDGVDVLSVSLGGEPSDYFNDGLAIGALHAVKNGITVVCSAGNSGLMDGTVTNTAPWIITVGASTVDREFETFVELRNGKRLQGTSLSSPLSEKKFYPLITGKQAKAANASEADALLCKPKSLDHEKAKGKVVVCLRGETARMDKGYQAALVGAAGMILCNDKAGGSEVIADPHVLPAAQISYTDGLAVFAYINSTDHALGYISSPTAKLGTKPAPFMVAFSSRGPNTVTPEILKPDITARTRSEHYSSL
ncbi:hypothetical protein OIU76_010773 [Salix suchowensis]|nr:hypothetical protein OIU76_010773 [Salix suchowensis]